MVEREGVGDRSERRIVLWGAWYGSHNVGDQAVLIGIARILERTLGACRITVLTDDADHVRSYGPVESRCPVSALDSRRQLPRVLHTLARSDLFVIGGGVPFFAEPRHLLAMGTLAGAAKAFRTPYMTWAVASQRVTSPTALRLFRRVLAGAAAVTCRDEATRRLFRASGFDGPVEVVADPVFALADQPELFTDAHPGWSGRRDVERPLAALIPRGVRAGDGSAGVHYGALASEDVDRKHACFAAALDWLWERGFQPVFLPMNTVAPDDDRAAARAIVARARYGEHALRFDEEVRPLAVPTILRQCRLAVTARVHGGILALLAGCPSVVYAFDVKHRGIAQRMGLEAYALDARGADPARITHLLDELVRNLADVKRETQETLTRLCSDALVPGRIAREIVSGRGRGGAGRERRPDPAPQERSVQPEKSLSGRNTVAQSPAR